MSSFRNQYPDFAAIERHIRRAQAERSVVLAAAIGNGLFAAWRAVARLFEPKPAERSPNGALLAKVRVPSHPARV